MDKKQFEKAVQQRKLVRVKQKGKTVEGRLIRGRGKYGTIKTEDGELISKPIWEIEPAE